MTVDIPVNSATQADTDTDWDYCGPSGSIPISDTAETPLVLEFINIINVSEHVKVNRALSLHAIAWD